jgi:hypothetical protein
MARARQRIRGIGITRQTLRVQLQPRLEASLPIDGIERYGFLHTSIVFLPLYSFIPFTRIQRAARDAPPAVSSSSKPRFGRKPSSKADKRAQILAYAPKGNNNPTSRGDYRSSYADSDPLGADDGDIPEWGRDYGAPKTKGKAQRQRSTTQSSAGSWADRSDRNDYASPNGYSATGTGYGEGRTGNSSGGGGRTVEEENWNHQF